MKKREKTQIRNKNYLLRYLVVFLFIILITIVIAMPDPVINFIGINKLVQSATSIFVNVSVTNGNTTFVDWNNSLIGWWRFDNSTDGRDHSTYNLEENLKYDGGVWTWFNSPQAIYYEGLTITGWVDAEGNIKVWEYNHLTQINHTTIVRSSLQVDDHINPAFVILPDKRIMIFYATHGYNSFCKISTNPLDTTSWGEETILGTTIGAYYAAYANAFYLSDEGLVYFFYRRGQEEEDWNRGIATYNYTSDTWTAARTLFAVSGERPYAKYWSNGKDRIDFLMNDGHPGEVANNSIYHFYYSGGNYYKTDGTLIGNNSSLPLTPDNVTLVYNASITGERSWVWDIVVKEDIPYITYALVENTSNHKYRYAFWNTTSNQWENHDITIGETDLYPTSNRGEEEYSGGVVIDSGNVSNVYLSKATQITDPKIFEIQKWFTNDGGITWINSENLTSNSTNKNFRPIVIKNYSSELKVLWVCGQYTSYTNYETEICSDFLGEISVIKTRNNVSGKFGDALQFDGTRNYYEVLDNETLEGMGGLTISLWLKKDSESDVNEDTLVSKWAGTGSGYLLRYDSANNQIDWIATTENGQKNCINTVSIEDNNWHNIIAVYNGTTIYLFLDGAKLSTKTAMTGSISINDVNLRIGDATWLNSNLTDYFKGVMDDVMIFNRGLSDNEIMSIYNSQSNPYFNNFTNLNNGTYTLRAYSQDVFGGRSSTELKTIIINTSYIDTNPVMTLTTPLNGSGRTGEGLIFNYSVIDDISIANCSLILNGEINQTRAGITKGVIQNFTINNILSGRYNWSINCTDSNNNMGASGINELSIIITSRFLGNTTDLTQEGDISNITHLIIEHPSYGKINFSESVDLSNGGNFDSYVNISQNRIEINSTALSALNKPARLTLYNLAYNNPQILKNGAVCSDCTEVSYSGGTLIFDVTGFSYYTTEETPTTIISGGSSSSPNGGRSWQCSRDSNCKTNQYCYEHKCYDFVCYSNEDCNFTRGEHCLDGKCIKLFDIKILKIDSPIEPEELFYFTYLMKGMADIKGDVVVNFWLEKDGQAVTSGSDVIYLGNFEEKTETTSIFLPTGTPKGIYDFYVEVDFEGHQTKAHRIVQVGFGNNWILVGLIVLILGFVFLLERKKINSEMKKEERFIKRHKITFSLMGLLIILGGLAFYLNKIGIISLQVTLFFTNTFSWVKNNIFPYFLPTNHYFYYIIGSSICLIILIILFFVFAKKKNKRKKKY